VCNVRGADPERYGLRSTARIRFAIERGLQDLLRLPQLSDQLERIRCVEPCRWIVRTNKGSLKCMRSFARVMLTADWLKSRFSAAWDTLRVF